MMRAAVLIFALAIISPLAPIVRAQAETAETDPATFAQAETLIAEFERELRELELTGADLSVFFGIPSDSEIARVRDAGERVVELAERAERVISLAVEESDRAGADGDAERRDRLITINAGQVPIRIVRGTLLAASAMPDGPERDAVFERANTALARVRTTSTWIDMETKTLRGIEGLLRSRPLAAIKQFDAARDDLADSLAGDQLAREFTPAVILGIVRATLDARGWSAAQTAQRALTARPPFETTGSPDPALAVVLADTRFSILAVRGEQEKTRTGRADVLAMAFAHYDELARTLIRAGLTAQQAWRVASEQAGEAIRPWMETQSQPPVARAGRSIALMQSQDSRDEGISLARDAMAETLGLNDDLHNLIALELMRTLAISSSSASVAEACTIASRLADIHYGDVRQQQYEPAIAVKLLEISASNDERDTAIRSLRRTSDAGIGEKLPLWRTHLAAALVRKGDEQSLREAVTVSELIESSQTQSTQSALNAIRTAKAHAAIYAITQSLTDAEAWLSKAERAAELASENTMTSALNQKSMALLALDRAHDALIVAQRAWDYLLDMRNPILAIECATALFDASEKVGKLDLILEVLKGIPTAGHASEFLSGRAHEIVHRRIARVSSRFLSDHGQDMSLETRIIALISSRLSREEDSARLVRIERDAAIALILTGEPERALETLLRIAARAGKSVDRLHLQAEARIAVRDDAGAFADLRALAAATEADTRTNDLYWYAWARMIEILDRRNTTGERTPVILREITRLRATDGFDLCAECAERIERVASRLNGEPSK